MDNSSDTVLTKNVVLRLEIISHFGLAGRHLYLLCNINTPSVAESCEEQDGLSYAVKGLIPYLFHSP